MKASRASSKANRPKRHLVQECVVKLRELILSYEPSARIGSQAEVAQRLGVGLVTTQQAARIIEYEGLLKVRRGPGGGYYGVRPDETMLERSIMAYMMGHGAGHEEALGLLLLVSCELAPSAAVCENPEYRSALEAILARVSSCNAVEQRVHLERDLRKLLLKMANRPMLELATKVSARLYAAAPSHALFQGQVGVEEWKAWRRSYIGGILSGDPEIAMFAALRHRQRILQRRDRLENSGSDYKVWSKILGAWNEPTV